MSNLDIAHLSKAASGFRTKLAGIKTALEPTADFWYRYDILGNLNHLDALLKGRHRDLSVLIKDLPIADIGAADGDLSFFLETMGVESDIIDHALTNQNHLQGARRLKDHLKANVNIYDLNLDSRFELPRSRYGLVFLLGILYHLKNPFFILENLAQHSEYCLFSTRVARYSPDHQVEIENIPVAYLLAPHECNNDPTNYWIFSPSGITRILERTGWKILDRLHVGNTSESDPATPEGDERAFFLLSSQKTLQR